MVNAVGEKIKLNHGCRNRPIPGFKGMDIDAHEGVDFVGDVSDLSRFESGSVAEIYGSHVIEHISHVRTLDVLKEWARVLEPGGILYVAVPDFARVVELYNSDGPGESGVGLTDWMTNYLWGDQVYGTAYHHAGFDFPRLRKLLLSAGFSEASRVVDFPIGDADDCSRKVSTFDGKPISLNVVAIR